MPRAADPGRRTAALSCGLGGDRREVPAIGRDRWYVGDVNCPQLTSPSLCGRRARIPRPGATVLVQRRLETRVTGAGQADKDPVSPDMVEPPPRLRGRRPWRSARR